MTSTPTAIAQPAACPVLARDADLTGLVRAACSVVLSADLPLTRKAHTLAVGEHLRGMVEPMDRPQPWKRLAVATGVLHDIGYAYPETGMHAVDGARVLRGLDAPAEMCTQVAHHSTARWEIAARGIPVDLDSEFPDPDPLLRALVWVADFTTSPRGKPISVAARLSDIRARYQPKSPVIRALDASLPAFDDAVVMVQSHTAVATPL